MGVFLQTLLGFPTVVYTGLMGLVVLYCLALIVGAADLDFLEGSVEGAGEALEGLEAVEGASGLLNFLRIGDAPLTVVGSSTIFFGTIYSYLGQRLLLPLAGDGLLQWLAGGGILFGAGFAGLLSSAVVLRPLINWFHSGPRALAGDAFVGKTVQLTTGSVTEKFGQARLEDGGAGVLLNVRCHEANAFSKGSELLVIEYDPDKHLYWVASTYALPEGDPRES